MVYAAGLYCKALSSPFIIYINKDSDSIILNLIEEMFKSKYKGIIWYCHNFGGFDAPFILKGLLKYNNSCIDKSDKFILDPVFKDNSLLKLRIGKVIGNSKIYVTIVDSYSILPNSLAKLGKNFDVDIQKGIFPYKFVNENRLFYVGNTPEISYYPNDTSLHDYNKHKCSNWSLQNETIKYLERDLLSLYSILIEANNKFHLYFDVDITKALTISKMAYQIMI